MKRILLLLLCFCLLSACSKKGENFIESNTISPISENSTQENSQSGALKVEAKYLRLYLGLDEDIKAELKGKTAEEISDYFSSLDEDTLKEIEKKASEKIFKRNVDFVKSDMKGRRLSVFGGRIRHH